MRVTFRKSAEFIEFGGSDMNLVELDIALRARGWCRVNMTSWSLPPRMITRLDAKPADPWQLKTDTGAGPITREFFPDAESVLEAVSARRHRGSAEFGGHRGHCEPLLVPVGHDLLGGGAPALPGAAPADRSAPAAPAQPLPNLLPRN